MTAELPRWQRVIGGCIVAFDAALILTYTGVGILTLPLVALAGVWGYNLGRR